VRSTRLGWVHFRICMALGVIARRWGQCWGAEWWLGIRLGIGMADGMGWDMHGIGGR
jgi:hypothetical protein